MKHGVILASILLVLGACYSKHPTAPELPEEPIPELGTIVTRVTMSGVSVEGVTVSIVGPEDQEGFVDSLGVTFSGILAGPYVLSISNIPDSIFFAETSRLVYVKKDETKNVSFEGELINLATASITAVVSVNSALASGVTVSGPGGALSTDVNGEVLFDSLFAGVYTIAISGFDPAVSFSNTSQSVTVEDRENKRVLFEGTMPQEQEMAIIEGYIYDDKSGNNLPDSNEGFASHEVRISSSAGARMMLTNPSGFYRFEDVAFADWTVSTPEISNCEFPGGLEQSVFVADFDTFIANFMARCQ